MAWIGAVVGLFVGGGMFLLRRKFWSAIRDLGQVIFWLVLLLGGVAAVALIGASSKGGDGGMAAMMGLIFGGIAVAATFVFSMLIGMVQAPRLGAQYRTVGMTVVMDVMIALLAVLAFHSLVYEPKVKALSDSIVGAETAHRMLVKDTQEAIPPQYRGVTVEMLNMVEQNQKELAQRGIQRPDFVPPEVAKAIRAAAAASAAGPQRLDYTAYGRLSEERTHFSYGLFAGWFLGVFFVPLFFPRIKVPPIVSKDAVAG